MFCLEWRVASCLQSIGFQSHPCSIAHIKQSNLPPSAAASHVSLHHSQPCSRAQIKHSKWPPWAAPLHVVEFQSQPFSRAHIKHSKWPFAAAYGHVLESQSHWCSRAHANVNFHGLKIWKGFKLLKYSIPFTKYHTKSIYYKALPAKVLSLHFQAATLIPYPYFFFFFERQP